ncbi:MAG: hypothetical protein A2521_03185 [Deltaproteobacteria bacterium RIFOXYD12_FULL_57_12]|nr:MAG: hypothetical protein A2521_03185 [Deltaproteobacteria bacterium RIFOXYD12_FULL_57_12]
MDLHISLPHYWSLDKIHATEKEITESLLTALGEEGDIMIHIDPCEPDYCPICHLEPCDVRQSEAGEPRRWTVQEVVAPRRPPRANNSNKQ